MDVNEALRAICSTGEGYCWYCDRKLPEEEEAISTGWDVRRIEGERVASIILVCPSCGKLKSQVGDEAVLRDLVLKTARLIC
ncbi:MAG TPA: hypothetical protein VFC10_15345 [Terriglobia bacterium]|jgi:hypothetical protein|nr:hypothetical protein [Terriglobia bacterium]